MPVPANRSSDNGTETAESTTALPTMRPQDNDSEVATEKLNARGRDDNSRQRRRVTGGSISAQDLLRREGRL